MADIGVGQPYTATVLVQDAEGEPATSGVSGSIHLYGPTSTEYLDLQAIAHQGDGYWGATFPGFVLATPGEYHWVIGTLTTPAGTLYNQGGSFIVGAVHPWTRTLRQVLEELATASGLGTVGTATAGTGLSVNATALAYGDDDEWVGSEIVLFVSGEPQVRRVTDFVAATGQFSWATVVSPAVAAGDRFIVCNAQGRGRPFAQLLAALRAAHDDAAPELDVSRATGLTVADGQHEYALPRAWVSINAVWARAVGDDADAWRPLAPADWDVRPDRRLLVLKAPPAAGTALRVDGTLPARFPATARALFDVPAGWLVKRARYELALMAGGREDMQQAGALYADTTRRRPRRTARANEKRL